MENLPLIRTGYMAPDRSSDLHFDEELEPSKTQQQFACECDINHIVKNNLFHPYDPMAVRFADVSDVLEFRDALNIVNVATRSFNDLPAEVRVQFNNDPAQLIEFLSDPANLEKAQELGFFPETKQETSPAVSSVLPEEPLAPSVKPIAKPSDLA